MQWAEADGKCAYRMSLWYDPICIPGAVEIVRPRLSVSVAILAKGRCFFGPSAQGLRLFRNLNLLFTN
jgi:hypothetical protein